jgi:hypothetical protein
MGSGAVDFVDHHLIFFGFELSKWWRVDPRNIQPRKSQAKVLGKPLTHTGRSAVQIVSIAMPHRSFTHREHEIWPIDACDVPESL